MSFKNKIASSHESLDFEAIVSLHRCKNQDFLGKVSLNVGLLTRDFNDERLFLSF